MTTDETTSQKAYRLISERDRVSEQVRRLRIQLAELEPIHRHLCQEAYNACDETRRDPTCGTVNP